MSTFGSEFSRACIPRDEWPSVNAADTAERVGEGGKVATAEGGMVLSASVTSNSPKPVPPARNAPRWCEVKLWLTMGYCPGGRATKWYKREWGIKFLQREWVRMDRCKESGDGWMDRSMHSHSKAFRVR